MAADRESLFHEWIGEYENLIFKIVSAYAVEAGEREDLSQEIIFQIWKSIPSFRGDSKPSTWIYRVALNTALVWKRREEKHRGRRETLYEPESNPGGGKNPGQTYESREVLEWLYEEIRRLGKVDRSLALLYLDDVAYREMAEILGITESNVGVRLNRIKNRLADAYARRTR